MRKGEPKSVLDKTFQKSKSGRCEKKTGLELLMARVVRVTGRF